MRNLLVFSILFCLSGLLSVINYHHPSDDDIYNPWLYSDVKSIDPIDATTSSLDIIAVLSRYHGENFQIRVDFLELVLAPNYSICILFDNQPGGKIPIEIAGIVKYIFDWNICLEYIESDLFSITGSKEIVDSTTVRLMVNIAQNYVELSLKNPPDNILSKNTRYQVSVTPSDSSEFGDFTETMLVNGMPPPPIDVGFLFWNIMDGSTPANILRSWAGAHKGPQSSRHGLFYLLTAAKDAQIPIHLCELSDPDTWSSIDYLGAMHWYRELGYFGFISGCGIMGEYDYAQFINNILVQNTTGTVQSFLKLINDYYYTADKSPLFLGGDLSNSDLGSPKIVNNIFDYISQHPWIRVTQNIPISKHFGHFAASPPLSLVDNQGDIYSRTEIPIPSGMNNIDLLTMIETQIMTAPQSNIRDDAMRLYLRFVTSNLPNISQARLSYLSQIGHLIAAAIWAQNPQPIYECSQDIDWDGQSECILSTNDIFLTFELDGGYLAFAYAKNESGVHQIMGPTSQFNVLRSDPTSFTHLPGIINDAGQIPGAFADSITNWQAYLGSASSTNIELHSNNGDIYKYFSIQGTIIHIKIINSGPVSPLRIPITIDPWLRYEENWGEKYWEKTEPAHWMWGAEDLITVGINSAADYTSSTFNWTHYAFNNPEDPNYDYSAGHLLPIPMALVEFQPTSLLLADIIIDP